MKGAWHDVIQSHTRDLKQNYVLMEHYIMMLIINYLLIIQFDKPRFDYK